MSKRDLEDAMFIAKTLKTEGFECYVVGGIVRDLIIFKEIEKDSEWDFATNAKPEEVTEIFKKKNITVIPTGIKHGTVTVVYRNKNYEITTYRSEENYINGRHPENITFVSSIEEDLSRRDFTINSMALDIINDKFIDLFGGKEDIKNKLIRALKDPSKKFQEDGLRLIRACRFCAKLKFRIEDKTLEAMKENKENIKNVSAERIRDELIKIMMANKPSIAIEYMRETGILEYIIPELTMGLNVSQNIYHKYDVYTHNIMTCNYISKFLKENENKKRIYRLKLAALLHDIAKPITKNEIIENGKELSTFYNHEVVGASIAKKILKNLRFSNEDIDWITRLIRHHMFYYTDEWTDSAVRRFMKNVDINLIPDLFIIREADRIGSGKRNSPSNSLEKLLKRIQKIIEEQNAISLKDLKINGNDVMNTLNIPPGPMVGKILNDILQIVIEDPRKNERETLLELIKTIKYNLYEKKL